MRRLLLGLVVSGAAACSPAPVAPPPATVSQLPPSTPALATSIASPPPSRCARPKPQVIAVAAPKDPPGCGLLRARVVDDVERTMRKRFKPTWASHKLVVDFGCDEVDEAIRTIDFEDGSGHGGSLRIFRFTTIPGTPVRYDVRAIGYSSYYNTGLAYARTEIDGTKLASSLEAIRVAMVVRLHDVELYADNGVMSGSFGTSSNDFHLAIRLTDSTDRVLDRKFTGYDSSSGQELRLPMQLAAEPIEAAIANVTFAAGAPTDPDRALFESHFLQTFAGSVNWWVGERLFEMVPALGSPNLVTTIVDWLKRGDPKGAGMDRIRAKAVAALASVTGLDLRNDAAGKERPLEEVVANYLEECK